MPLLRNPSLTELETHTGAFKHPRTCEGLPGAVRGPLWKASVFVRLLLSWTACLLLPFWKRYSEGCFCHILMDVVPEKVGRNPALSSGEEAALRILFTVMLRALTPL